MGVAPPPPVPGMPGMSTPGAGSPGAGRGAAPTGFVMKPARMVIGTFKIRPKRWVQTPKMQNPMLVFEVYDEGEMAKARNNQPHFQGEEVTVTIWQGRADSGAVFAALGYPESAVPKSPEGYPIYPIAQILERAPLVWATVTQKESATQPGRFFPDVQFGQLVSPATKGAA